MNHCDIRLSLRTDCYFFAGNFLGFLPPLEPTFRTAVPFLGQTTSNSLVCPRNGTDCVSRRVKALLEVRTRTGTFSLLYAIWAVYVATKL